MSLQKGKRIGALWVRKSKDGKKYLSGIIETMYGDIQIAAFINDKKEKENQPDYNLVSNGLVQEERERSTSSRDPLDDGGDGFPDENIMGKDDLEEIIEL